MTHLEMLEKIWEQQEPDSRGVRRPILYERCDYKGIGWRLYTWSLIGGGDAIAVEGSRNLKEAIETAYNKLFPKEKGEHNAEKTA